MPYGTIELPMSMIIAAEAYAEREHRSIVEVFADLLKARYGFSLAVSVGRSSEKRACRTITPIVKSLRGIAKVPVGASEEDVLADSLLEKYEALG